VEVAPRGLRALLAAALLLLLATGAVHVVREALRDKTPNQTHARRLGLEEYLYLVAPLDADQEQDPREKQLVELLARSKQALEIPVARQAVLNATKDGRVTPEELRHLETLLARASALAAEYPELARSTGSNHTLFHVALSLHESQPQLLKELYRSTTAAKASRREALLAQAIALLHELGYTRSVKVLNPSTGSFEEKNPQPPARPGGSQLHPRTHRRPPKAQQPRPLATRQRHHDQPRNIRLQASNREGREREHLRDREQRHPKRHLDARRALEKNSLCC
jgi:tellurite resistance protein